jgi:hypothetical protein
MSAPDVVTVVATRADGGLTVSRFVENEYRDPTAEERRSGIERVLVRHNEITPEWINEIYARKARDTGKVIVSWRIVPNDFIDDDTDDTYRNAWVDEGKNKPGHHMPKAREIHRARLRRARIAEFHRLDNDYRIADEAGDQKAKKDVGTLKQKFRDVTGDPRIEDALTVEELKALPLDVLVPETLGVKDTGKMRVNSRIEGLATDGRT